MAPGMLAKHQLALFEPDGFRCHDFVGGFLLQHAVLVDSGLMCKSVRPHNRLVARDDHACQLADQAAGTGDFGQHQGCLGIKKLAACLQRQCYFFNSGIPRTFADPVDGTFDLVGTILNGSERVRCSHAQIIMTVGAKLDFLNIRHSVFKKLEDRTIFRWVQIAYSIRNIDYICTFPNRHCHHFSHEVAFGAAGILK
ncbi:hypothetical protein D3C73_715450 [compost metagenome]